MQLLFQEKERPNQEGYTLKRMHAFTNYEIAYEKLFKQEDQDGYINELMEALNSGYERVDVQDRRDTGTQTNLKLCEMDDDSIKNVIQDIIFDTSDEYDFKDVYTSEDEEFASVSSEQVEEMVNLEDAKKMMKKTLFGIRTDPVSGRIILTIHDDKGEAEIVPIGQGMVSDIKVSINPKWADYPEVTITNSENELIQPKSYKERPHDSDMIAVDAVNLFEHQSVDHLDISFSAVDWHSDGLQLPRKKLNSDIWSESEIITPAQNVKKREKSKKRKLGKGLCKGSKAAKKPSENGDTYRESQTNEAVKLRFDSTSAEYCPLSQTASHPTKTKLVTNVGESSAVSKPDDTDLLLDKSNETGTESALQAAVKDHGFQSRGDKLHDANQLSIKEGESRKREYEKDLYLDLQEPKESKTTADVTVGGGNLARVSEKLAGRAQPLAQSVTETRKPKPELTDRVVEKDAALLLNMPAASTQTSSSVDVPTRRSSMLDTLQRVEEEMRPLKHQLAEIQRQMWEIDASYPEASTDSPAGRPDQPSTSFYPPSGFVMPVRSLCKCPPNECHPSPQVRCKKGVQERPLSSPWPFFSLPSAELARRLIPSRRNIPDSNPSTSQSVSSKPDDVPSEQNTGHSSKSNDNNK